MLMANEITGIWANYEGSYGVSLIKRFRQPKKHLKMGGKVGEGESSLLWFRAAVRLTKY